ncbi:MAG: XkdX family protein [Phascolarctobacterium sp.]|nr:MAG: XkdX family protein [Phascolarctobacterium sp.]
MRAVAESIKRLYEAGKLTGEQLAQRVEKGTLTLEEYNEIIEEKRKNV